MNYKEFAGKVRAKYPGAYDAVDDRELAQRVVAKYPVYQDQVQFDDVPTASKTESALRAAAQGLTLGHADELTATAESMLTDKPRAQALEESRQNYKTAHEAHPVISNAVEIGTSMAPMAGITAVTGPAGPAISGALAAEGASNDPLLSKETAKDVALGGATGWAAGKVGDMLAAKLNPSKLATMAEEKAVLAGNPTPTVFKTMTDEGTVGRAGRALLDTGSLSPFASADDIAANVEKHTARVGKEIGDFLDQATASGQLMTTDDLVRALEQRRDVMLKGANPNMGDHQAIAGAFNKAIDDVMAFGKSFSPDPIMGMTGSTKGTPLTFDVVNHIKKMVQSNMPNKMVSTELDDMAGKAAAGTVRQSMDDALEAVPGSAEWQKNKQLYGGLLDAGELFGKKAAAEAVAKPMSAQEARIGTLGAVGTGSMGLAAGVTAVWHGIVHYGRQNTALLADWLAKNEGQALQALGKYGPALVNAAKRGPQALAVHIYTLSQQDPDFRAKMDEAKQ